MGTPDLRLDQGGNIDFRITRMLKSYSKADPPPNRVKPVPVAVIRRILVVAHAGPDPVQQCLADMICLAFFFLLRPGEYSISPSESTPFELKDAQLFVGQTKLNLATASEAAIMSASFASLTFDKQKNGVRGEVVGHGPSGNPLLCPVRALGRRIIHLRAHHAPQDTPLAHCHTDNGTISKIVPTMITDTIRLAVRFLGPSLGFLAKDVTARCLRASGANALLCAGVDTDVIRLIGRWRSDEMLRYLHTQVGPLLRGFSQRMLSGGAFTLIPNQEVPTF